MHKCCHNIDNILLWKVCVRGFVIEDVEVG